MLQALKKLSTFQTHVPLSVACIFYNFPKHVSQEQLTLMQVKGQLSTVETLDNTRNSFARLDYHDECEAAINEQIKYILYFSSRKALEQLPTALPVHV